MSHSSIPNFLLNALWSTKKIPTDRELVNYIGEDAEKLKIWDNECTITTSDIYKYFVPDGRHPNRFAHEKIFEYIKGLN